MKIKLSKSQWEKIGRTAGWMKAAVHGDTTPQDDMLDARDSYPKFDFLLKRFEEYSPELIVNAIKKFSKQFSDPWMEPEQLAKIQGVTIETIPEALNAFRDHGDLEKILSILGGKL